MKLSARFCFSFLFFANLAVSQNWIQTNIGDFATIDFPSQSEIVKQGEQSAFNVVDDNAIYILTVSRLTKQQSKLISDEGLSEFYEGLTKGVLRGSNAQLVSKVEVSINNVKGLEIEFFSYKNPSLPSQRYKRIFLLNAELISIDFIPITDNERLREELKVQFFNSLNFSQSTTDSNSDNIISNDEVVATDKAFRIGYINRTDCSCTIFHLFNCRNNITDKVFD